MAAVSRCRWKCAALAALLVAAGVITAAMAGCWPKAERHRQGTREALPYGKTSEHLESSASGEVRADQRPAEVAHDSMHVLEFTGRRSDLTLATQQTVAGHLKHQRSLPVADGIYFRAIDANGNPLADGTITDPFVVRPPLPRDGGAGAGPMAKAEAFFHVRVPALAGVVAVELFHVTHELAAAGRYAAPERMMGRFPVTARSGN